MKKFYLFLFVLSLAFESARAQCPNLVWSDEFTGSSLNTSNWNYQLGTGCDEGICGWGNNELQSYQEQNVTVSNGSLLITAKKERIRGSQYTSGRINSKGKGDFTYGRFEARIKLPQGGGLWPAFWMLSTNEPYGSWPQSGEIDIMEFVSSKSNETLGYIHYGDLYPGNQNQGSTFELAQGDFFDDFHEFALEWENGELRWFVDGILFQTKTPSDLAPYNWPFDQDFHFLLNVAVGGNLGGTVDNSIFPATMEVDYVRVYDAGRPYIVGNRLVEFQSVGETYQIGNVGPNTQVSWAIPAGATIVSGQGSSQIVVDWGTSGGVITASVSTSCGTEQLQIPVEMASSYVQEFSFENFDQAGQLTLISSDGILTEVTNPSPNAVNSSSVVGRYIRNASAQYDVINYTTAAITNAGSYVDGSKRFYLDVHTAAPIGTPIIIQLESPDATPSNYPGGRHSRYFGYTSKQNNWHRVYFRFEDRPDGSVADSNVSNLLILVNSNTFTGDTYYLDNLDSYQVDNGQPTNEPPSVALTTPGEGAVFDSGTLVSVAANATDVDGSIALVEFFVNGASIGTDTNSPYSANWTIGSGNYAITAVATDNEGAQTTSSSISVTGQITGEATDCFVSSIITGSVGAGKGSKSGLATVIISNNLGQPVANASVLGSFSGTFTESVTGVTNAAGQIDFVTSGSAKGGIVVDFCIDDVSHASLSYNPSLNSLSCAGSNARVGGSEEVLSLEETILPSMNISFYPNPAQDWLTLSIQSPEDEFLTGVLYDMSGKIIKRVGGQVLTGDNEIKINLSAEKKGAYMLHLRTGDRTEIIRVLKQ